MNDIVRKFYLASIVSVIAFVFTGGCAKGIHSGSNGPEKQGIESGVEVTGWSSWSNDDKLTVAFSAQETKSGNGSMKLFFPDIEPRGYHDWSFWSDELVSVEPGQTWTASAWVKYENTGRIGLEIMAISNGESVPGWSSGSGWTSGMAAAYGSGDWKLLEATAKIPQGAGQIYVRFTGSGKTTAWIDSVMLRSGPAQIVRAPRPQVEGWAFHKERVKEMPGRGVVAIPQENGSIYLQWRLLESDPEDVAFNVYRRTGNQQHVKLNTKPITLTTDFTDTSAKTKVRNAYFVRSVKDAQEYETSEIFIVDAHTETKPFISIKLNSDTTTFQSVGVGDLNGDGKYDFVIKTPNSSLDPWY
jgi:hypothetical protein